MSTTPEPGTAESTDAPRKTRQQRLAELAEAHYQWSLRHESGPHAEEPTTEATAEDGEPTEWHPLVAADPSAEDEFMAEAQHILHQ